MTAERQRARKEGRPAPRGFGAERLNKTAGNALRIENCQIENRGGNAQRIYKEYKSKNQNAKQKPNPGIVNWGAGKHFVTYNGVICNLISKDVLPKYAYYQLLKQDFNSMAKNSSQPFVSYKELNEVIIPIPSPTEQARIVTILDKFDALTTSITEGLPREIELRQKQYGYYREMLLSFPKVENAQ